MLSETAAKIRVTKEKEGCVISALKESKYYSFFPESACLHYNYYNVVMLQTTYDP